MQVNSGAHFWVLDSRRTLLAMRTEQSEGKAQLQCSVVERAALFSALQPRSDLEEHHDLLKE